MILLLKVFTTFFQCAEASQEVRGPPQELSAGTQDEDRRAVPQPHLPGFATHHDTAGEGAAMAVGDPEGPRSSAATATPCADTLRGVGGPTAVPGPSRPQRGTPVPVLRKAQRQGRRGSR